MDQEEGIDNYRDLLFQKSAIWKADDFNIVMRKCMTRKGKVFLFNGAVHVNISDTPTCTCPRSRYNQCKHIAVCNKVNISSLPIITDTVCEKPFIRLVKKDGWGLVTNEGGSLHCNTCTRLYNQKSCEHLTEVREAAVAVDAAAAEVCDAADVAAMPSESTEDLSNNHQEILTEDLFGITENDIEILSKKKINAYPMDNDTKSMSSLQAAGLSSFPSVLCPPQSQCEHGNVLVPQLVGQAYILSLGAAIVETFDEGEIKAIMVYTTSSQRCRCTNHYDGFAHNLVNINNKLFLTYTTAMFLKLALLDGLTYHSLSR